jgi:hypothetical protein
MEVDKKLYEEIKEYCTLNGLKPKEYINDLLKKAFMEDKYGNKPFMTNKIRVESVLVKADEPDRNGIVYTKEALEKAVEQYKEKVTIGKDGDIFLGELTHLDKNLDKMSQLDVENVDLDKNSSTNSNNVSQSGKKLVKKHTIKPIK